MPNLPYRPPPVRAAPSASRCPDTPGEPNKSALPAAVRRLPWFLISAAIHLALLLWVTTSVPPRARSGPEHPMQIGLYVERPAPPAPKPTPPEPQEAPPQNPPEPSETPAPRAAESPTPPEQPPVTGPSSTGQPPVLAVSPGPQPMRGLFAARSPAARDASVHRWGGTPASEKAVDLGLAWLARRQDAKTGRWSDGDPALRLSPSLTGLALLAFLARGHTHTGEGQYRSTVARGVDHLLDLQGASGRFGPPYHPRENRYLMYHQAIAALALAETYAMSRDPRLAPAVRRAVDFIVQAQQNGGGWDYGDRPTGRNDTSVTGWQLMALKSAHAAGIEVPWQALFRSLRYLSRMTDPRGRVSYADQDPHAWRRGPGMVAVGMLCLQILGWPAETKVFAQQTDSLLRHGPDWEAVRSRDRQRYLHTLYYWYYATLALFQVGGEPWAAWNQRLRPALTEHQRRRGAERGSWDPPESGFDSVGGRVYATAMAVLCLEVYYRYLPFQRSPGFDACDLLTRAAKVRGSRLRRQALRLLGQYPGPEAEAILVEAVDDADEAARQAAIEALVARGSNAVLPALRQDLAHRQAGVRVRALGQLDRLGRREASPLLIEALRDPQRTVRHRAAIALRRLTGQRLGFQADAVAVEREAAIERWSAWWNAKHGQPPADLRGSVLVVDASISDAVVIDVGRRHGVREGLRLQVVRDGQAIAVLEARRLKPGMTIARVLRRQGGAIQVGDVVRPLKRRAGSED